MTNAELDQLDQLSAASTPGPWEWSDDAAGIIGGPDNASVFINNGRGYGDPSEEDTAFISTARTALPSLVAEVRRLRAELAASKGCPWSSPLDTTICPVHGGPIRDCPLPTTVFAAPSTAPAPPASAPPAA